MARAANSTIHLAGILLALTAKIGFAQSFGLQPCKGEQDREPCTVTQSGPFKSVQLKPGMNAQVVDNYIVVSWAGPAKKVTMGGIEVDSPLPLVADDLHQVLIRYNKAPKLKSIIYFYVTRADGSTVTEYSEFHGPHSNQIPATAATPGEKMSFGDAAPGAQVWLPPGYQAGRRYPIVYVADSGDNRGALVAEAIRKGELDPVIVVGVDACAKSKRDQYCRGQHYMDMKGFPPYTDPTRFREYEKFLIDTVVAQVEATYGAPEDASQRAVSGYSNGGAWAASMALRNPKLFGRAIAMSPGGNMLYRIAPKGRTVFAMSGGELEPSFTRHAQCFAGAIVDTGGTATMRLYPSGHSEVMWAEEFMVAMKDWLGVPRPQLKLGPSRPTWCPKLAIS